jgi:hypothetical protein
MSEISNSLSDYYSKKKVLIEESIDSVIPYTCTFESMNHIVGQVDLSWDYRTLQKTFFDIVYKYLDKKTEKVICLDTCLFLEAAGNELEKFIPILGLPAFFETSNEIFQDITTWTNKNGQKPDEISTLDISIAGNVSIALLTLPINNLLFRRLDMDPEKLLKLYESYTTNIFNSLFGNGLKLFWEQSKKIPPDLNEYYGSASLTKKGFLKFGGDLWLIFNDRKHDEYIVSALNKFIETISIAIQIERDLLSFERIQIEPENNNTDHFNPCNNFLFIYAASRYNDTFHFQRAISPEYCIDLIGRAGAVNYANEQINELKKISDNALRLLPIESTYKELLKSYCDYLVSK